MTSIANMKYRNDLSINANVPGKLLKKTISTVPGLSMSK